MESELQKIDEDFFSSLSFRMRRNRKSEALRTMLSETTLLKRDLIQPFFVIKGSKQKEAISFMPNIFRESADLLIIRAEKLHKMGMQAVALFPVIPSLQKSLAAEEALNPEGILPQTIRLLKKELPQISIITDIALDPYTSHGHDGIVNEYGEILNDETVKILGKMAVVLAEAGADIVAPSDMMDGRVGYIRKLLDLHHFENTSILSYSCKYASSLYSPYRCALGSNLSFGDKKSYQLDPSNSREALLEAALDEKEGADIIMVKPATLYLDIIAKIRVFCNKPIAAYHVSGEYAMVMAAGEKGYLDTNRVFLESLTSIKRAGADIILTYAAEQLLPFLP